MDRNLGVVNAATVGEKGWLPAMTLLERRRPQDFGRGPRGDQVTTHQTLVLVLPPDAAQALAAYLQNSGGGGLPLLSTTTSPQLTEPADAAQ